MCQVKGAGKVVETIYKYDDERRELAFILEGQKIPFFMRKIDNTWSVKPIPVNESRAIFSTKKSVISVSPCSIACARGISRSDRNNRLEIQERMNSTEGGKMPLLNEKVLLILVRALERSPWGPSDFLKTQNLGVDSKVGLGFIIGFNVRNW